MMTFLTRRSALLVAATFAATLGLAAVAEWEAEHGVLTEAELKTARQRLASSHRPGRTGRRRRSKSPT